MKDLVARIRAFLAGRLLQRRVLIVAVPVAVLAALVAACLLLPGILVRMRAASLGVQLDWDRLELGSGTAKLRGVRAKLAGVDGLRIEVDRLRVATRGLDVESFDAGRVTVALEGSATDRVLELAAWSAIHARAYRLPGASSDVRVDWRARAGDPSWLTLAAGSLRTDGKTGRLSGTVTLGGVSLGPVTTTVAADASGVTIEAGKGAAEEASIVARVSTSPAPPSVEITLRPVKLESLGASMGLRLPAPGAVASGHAKLTLGERSGAESIRGTASLVLDGWVPSHPKALGGILGKKTSIATRLAVAENRTKVTLSEVVVRAGKLELKGAGTVTRAGNHAVAKLELSGPLACADLVRSAATDTLGGLLGDVAGRAVDGSVKVNVSVDADSRDLPAAKVRTTVGVGCGLKLPGL